ncbi:MAG: HAMP domain-containing protein [Leptospira sp.]|nr:HAMP domain-containing protein [Leptospira sp.]
MIFIFIKNPAAFVILFFLVKISFEFQGDDYPNIKKSILGLLVISSIGIGILNFISYFYRDIVFDQKMGFFIPSTESDLLIVKLGVFLFTLHCGLHILLMIGVIISKLKIKEGDQKKAIIGFISVIVALALIVSSSMLSDLGLMSRGVYLFILINSFNYIIIYFITMGLGRGRISSGVGFKIMMFNLSVVSMIMSLLVIFLIDHFQKENFKNLSMESYLIRNQITKDLDSIDTILSDYVVNMYENKYLLKKSDFDILPIDKSRKANFENIRIEYFHEKSLRGLFFTLDIMANNIHYMIAYPYIKIREPLHYFVLSLLFVLFVGLILVFLAYPLLHKNNIIQPLEKILKAMDQVKKGDLDINLVSKFDDEIGEITQSFNQMILVIKVYQETLELRIQERTSELEQKLVELKNTQKQLIYSERMSTLGRISSNVAHEINNPLATIYASAKRLEREFEKDNIFSKIIDKVRVKPANPQMMISQISTKEKLEKKKNLETIFLNKGFEHPEKVADLFINRGIFELPSELIQELDIESNPGIVLNDLDIYTNRMHIDGILTAVERASKISFALKHYSRAASKKSKVSISLEEEFESVLLIYNNLLEGNIRVEKYFDKIPNIMGHPEQLVQVWSNLIFNAIQALPKQKGIIKVRIKKNLNLCIVEIEDNGVGIPENSINEIFDPFFTSKEIGAGIGLGLTIAKEIIVAHNGTIEVESNPGHTVFRVMLPI